MLLSGLEHKTLSPMMPKPLPSFTDWYGEAQSGLGTHLEKVSEVQGDGSVVPE